MAGRSDETGHAAPAGAGGAHTGHWPGVGDFDDLVRRYRRELHVHCYRMLGSFVATNACLDTLRRDARRAVPAPSGAPVGWGPSVAVMPWIQPYPDALLDEMAADQPGPEAVAVSRETMSLAFLAAIQLLPPRQRAVLILRDVLSWPAAEADPGQRRLLERFIAAHEQADPEALIALRFEHGRLIDMAAFEQPSMFAAFGLPASL